MEKMRLLCAMVFLLGVSSVWATDATNWQVSSGNWSEETNWDNGEPLQYSLFASVDNGGTVTIDQMGETCVSLYLGNLDPSYRGYANMTGGSLYANGYIFVGNQGGDTAGDHSKFTQSGGAVTTDQGLWMGASLNSSSGEYYMTGGTLDTQSAVYIGDHGTGKFVQTGGTVTVDRGLGGEFYIGRNSGSHGSYELSGTGHLISTWEERVGYDGTGVFLQNGGTHQAHDLRVGGMGTYTLNNGSLMVDNLYSGAFTQTGGNVYDNPSGTGDGYISVGAYTLENGTVTMNKIALNGSGSNFDQTGGQVILADALNDARAEILGGVYGVSGGSSDLGDIVLGAPYWTERTGSLKVLGDDALIVADNFWQSAHGALYSIFDADGLSTIDVSGAAVLDGTFCVEDPTGMAPYGTFDVLVADGLISGDFSNVYLPGPDWSYGISGYDTLWVEHVPEPTTILLLGLGGLALRKRRRS